MYLRYKRGRYVATAQEVVVVEKSQRKIYRFSPPENEPVWRIEADVTVYRDDEEGFAASYAMRSDTFEHMPELDDVLNLLFEATKKHERSAKKAKGSKK